MTALPLNFTDLRIGIVGVGNVARSNYLPWLAKQPGISLYYYSRTAASMDAAIERFGGQATRSLEDLAAEQLDVILILSDETTHVPIARELVKYGVKRLFIEKPLQATYGQANVTEQDFYDAKQLLQEAEASDTDIAMNFNYRFFEQSLHIKQLVRTRNLGQLLQSTWFVHYACWSHSIDLLRHFGGPVHTVAALQGAQPYGTGHMQATDLTAAFTMRSGGVGTIVGTSSSAFHLPLYHVTLNFEHGTIQFSDLDARLTLYQEGSNFSESFSLMSDKSRWAQYSASFEHSLEAYFQAIGNNESPPVTGMDGLAELQFEAALRRSAATGQTVVLEESFPM